LTNIFKLPGTIRREQENGVRNRFISPGNPEALMAEELDPKELVTPEEAEPLGHLTEQSSYPSSPR